MLINPLTSHCLVGINNFLNFFPLPCIGLAKNNAIIYKEEVVNIRTTSRFTPLILLAFSNSLINVLKPSAQMR